MNNNELLYFYDPITLLKRMEKTLSEIGPKKFFSNPDDETKRVRESLAEFFFILALKKDTGKDWWLYQPKDQFPDFDLMTVNQLKKKIFITLDRFELVTIPDRCNSFEEALSIVRGKITKGYPENYNLLVFVNHIKSREWVKLLKQQLVKSYPFKSIWTVYLLFKGKDNPYSAVVNQICPPSQCSIETSFDNKALWEMGPLPIFMEEIEIEGKKCRAFKEDFMKEFRLMLKKISLGNRKSGVV